MNYKLFSTVYFFLAVSSFVYSCSGSLAHSKKDTVSNVSSEKLSNNRRVTFLETNSVDNTRLSINNNDDDSIQNASIESFSQQVLQNGNNKAVVSQREISIQTSIEDKSPEILIQALKEKIQEVEKNLRFKESVVVEQRKEVELKRMQMSKMLEDNCRNNLQLQLVIAKNSIYYNKQVSKMQEDHRRNMIAVAIVSAVSTLVVQKILSEVSSITNWFGSSTKGGSESKS